jgi:hypothetical protein
MHNPLLHPEAAFKHLYVVPTCGKIDPGIDTVIEEISTAISRELLSGDDIALVVLEQGNSKSVTHNKKVLFNKEFLCTLPFKCYQIEPSLLSEFLSAVCSHDPRLLRFFSEHKGNDGRTGNILSLIASAFQATYLHRRSPLNFPEPANGRSAPHLVTELTYIKNSPQENLMIGAKNQCTPAVDGTMFTSKQSLISDLNTFVCIHPAERNAVPVKTRKTPVPASSSTEPDLRNSTSKNLFRHFSSPPHTHTLNDSQMFRQMCNSVNIPLVSYNPPHRSSPPQTQESTRRMQPAAYFTKVARYVDYVTMYQALPQQYTGNEQPVSRQLANNLKAISGKALPIIAQRCRRISAFAELFLKLQSDEGNTICKAIKLALPSIVKMNDQYVNDHAYLQEHWATLVKRAAG